MKDLEGVKDLEINKLMDKLKLKKIQKLKEDGLTWIQIAVLTLVGVIGSALLLRCIFRKMISVNSTKTNKIRIIKENTIVKRSPKTIKRQPKKKGKEVETEDEIETIETDEFINAPKETVVISPENKSLNSLYYK